MTNITYIAITREDLDDLLCQAIEKGKEIEKQRSLSDFITREEAMKILGLKSVIAFCNKVKNREFSEYGDKPKLYKKSEIMKYLERTKH